MYYIGVDLGTSAVKLIMMEKDGINYGKQHVLNSCGIILYSKTFVSVCVYSL